MKNRGHMTTLEVIRNSQYLLRRSEWTMNGMILARGIGLWSMLCIEVLNVHKVRQNELRVIPLRELLKGKGSPYSITERRVPELIPVLCSQLAGGVSHKPGGRLPLLSARPAVTFATLKRAATSFAAW